MKNNFIYALSLILFVLIGIFGIGLGSNKLVQLFLNEKLQIYLTSDILRAIFIFFYVFCISKYIFKIDLLEILQSSNKSKQISTGILIGFVMVSLGFLILYSTNSIEWSRPDSFNEFYFSIFVIIITAITTAIWEELIIRGLLLRGLLLRFDNKLALILSASFFGVVHLLGPSPSILVVLSTFVAGILLGLLFIQTKNIYTSMGLHFSWNCLQYFLFSKKIFSVKYVNNFLAGESTFEEGLVAIVITLTVLAMVLFFKLGGIKNDSIIQS